MAVFSLSAPLITPLLFASTCSFFFLQASCYNVDIYLSPFINSSPPIPTCHTPSSSSRLSLFGFLSSNDPNEEMPNAEDRRLRLLQVADSLFSHSFSRSIKGEDYTDQGNLKGDTDKGSIERLISELSTNDAVNMLTEEVMGTKEEGDTTDGYLRQLGILRATDRIKKIGEIFLGDVRSNGLPSVPSVVGLSEILLCLVDALGRKRDVLLRHAGGRFKVEEDEQQRNLGELICKCNNESKNAKGKCQLIKLLLLGLACSNPLTCGASTPLATHLHQVSASDPAWSLPFNPIFPTPNIIPLSIVQDEGLTYSLLWTAISLLVKTSTSAACSEESIEMEMPSWRLIITFMAHEETTSTTSVQITPLAALFQRQNSVDNRLNDLLVVIRGTQTEGEWRLDFSYDQILGDLKLIKAGVHRGFASVALAMWQSLQVVVTQMQQSGNLGLVVITGHSLGAGVASILSYLLAGSVPTIHPSLEIPSVRVVLFAPPISGSKEFMASLAKMVSLRAIVGELDPIPHLPCLDMLACPESVVPVPTGPFGDSYQYGGYFGRIVIPASLLGGVWKSSGSNMNVKAWHICAYGCWTSFFTTPSNISDPSSFFSSGEGLWCASPIESSTPTLLECPYLPAVKPVEIPVPPSSRQEAALHDFWFQDGPF